jgi:hypothetical protein
MTLYKWPWVGKISHSYAFDYEEYSFGEVFPEDDNGMYPADKVKLSKLLTGVKDKLTYVYDMSNNWQHSIVLEKILTSDNTTPLCTHAAGGLSTRRLWWFGWLLSFTLGFK